MNLKLTTADVVAVLAGGLVGCALVLVCVEAWLRRL